MLPAILPCKRKKKKSDNTLESNDKINESDGRQKYQYWLGTVSWVRSCFPPPKTQESKTFDTDAPILAVGVQFYFNWLSKDVHVVYWRPCEIDINGETMGKMCKHCGLDLSSSFITPAWNGPVDKLLPPYPLSLTKEINVPSGLSVDTRNRISRCIDSLRQKVAREDDIDSFTPSESYVKVVDLFDIL